MADQKKPMFMSQPDLADLTGHTRPIIQARWLRSQSIPFLCNGAGVLIVTVLAVQEKLNGSIVAGEPSELDASNLMKNITETWDKVSEPLMAELIGSTSRALQTRRSRGKIPAHFWCKVDGQVLYSIRRYEDWLDGHWQPAPSNSAGGSPVSRGPGRLRKPVMNPSPFRIV